MQYSKNQSGQACFSRLFSRMVWPLQNDVSYLEDIKNRVGENANIIKIDVGKNPQAATTYQVRGVPTLILFKNGKPLWRQSGVVTANELEKLINENK